MNQRHWKLLFHVLALVHDTCITNILVINYWSQILFQYMYNVLILYKLCLDLSEFHQANPPAEILAGGPTGWTLPGEPGGEQARQIWLLHLDSNLTATLAHSTSIYWE